MNSAYLALFLFGAVASITGMFVMFKSLRSSPEGYEDGEGFHYGRPGQQRVARVAVTEARFEHQTAA